ncbi:hypothetical protein BTR14_00985 [Rhizobium rhizosphaerae]|uniref:Uncharacterized protein n=1 Tax=Xaviernesmea rhizosphaerae TaxID=1672749 RepID=A0ABX3PIY4_9HYPH|nr:hypothetical protein BTR14_00985 [Xaviernesmea rhizosphaerae]
MLAIRSSILSLPACRHHFGLSVQLCPARLNIGPAGARSVDLPRRPIPLAGPLPFPAGDPILADP